jgi:hypothetical protein
MPSLVVSLAGKPQSTNAITRPCTRIGRAPGNDIVLAASTVSSTHAVITLSGTKLAIEDLESSNGTFVDRRRITRADLEDGSIVSIGNYTLKLVADRRAMAYEPTMLVRSSAVARTAYLQRLDGPLRGECVELNKVVSTLGKPGECMVTFIRRGDDFAVRFTDGRRAPRLNGDVLGDTPVRLNAGDVLETDSGHLQFLLEVPNVPLAGTSDRVQPLERVAPAARPLSWVRRALFGAPATQREQQSRDCSASDRKDGSADRGPR